MNGMCNEMVKKVSLAALILSVIFSLHIESLLERGKNMVIFAPVEGIEKTGIDNLKIFANKSALIDSMAIYFMQNISRVSNKPSNINLYGVDEKYMDMKGIELYTGRWILENDLRGKKPYAVISEKTAIKLFAGLQCAGMPIYISNMEYKVIGVYKERKSISENMSAMAEDVIFIPYTTMDIKNKPARILIRTKENIAEMFLNQLKNGVNQIVDDCDMQSIDQEIKRQLNIKNLCFLAVYIIFIMYGVKLTKAKIKNQYGVIKNCLESVYPREFIKLYYIEILKLLVYPLIFIATAFILYRLMHIQLYIDPKLIPKRLIDIDELFKKLSAHYINRNNSVIVNDTLSNQTGYAGFLLACSGLVSVVSAYFLTKDQSKKMEVH